MDRGNENPTRHLLWWLRKTTKKPQSGWSAPGFEARTSRMLVSCVTMEPPRSLVKDFFIRYYLETLQHLGHIASRIFGCIPEGCVFLLLCVVNVSIVKFTELILWYINLMNNGQMNRGNENPTQHLPWWLRKTTKKTLVRLVGTGIWNRDLSMRVSSVTAEPPRSVVKDCRHML